MPLNIYIPLLILACIPFFYIDILIHEIGHAISGLIVGFHTNSITIGAKQEIFRINIKGSRLVFKTGLRGGQILSGVIPESGRYFKWKYLFYISGGLLAQGIITILVVLIFNVYVPDIINPQKITLAHVFVGTNLFIIALNLLPIKRKSKGEIRSPDGYKIITLPKRKPEDLIMELKVIAAYKLFEEKKYEAAEISFRAICQLPPPSLIPTINLSSALVRQCKIDEAIDYLEPLLERYDKDQNAFLMYNNLAWAYLLKGDKDSQEKADKYSGHALKLNPDNRILKNSRGCILIELGVVDDGINILLENVDLRKPTRVKPYNYVEAAYVAYASFLKNDIDTAHEYLKKVLTSSSELEQDASLIVKRIKTRIMLD